MDINEFYKKVKNQTFNSTGIFSWFKQNDNVQITKKGDVMQLVIPKDNIIIPMHSNKIKIYSTTEYDKLEYRSNTRQTKEPISNDTWMVLNLIFSTTITKKHHIDIIKYKSGTSKIIVDIKETERGMTTKSLKIKNTYIC